MGLFCCLPGLLFFSFAACSLCRAQNGKPCQKPCQLNISNVEAERGNIFASDGSLLATSVPEYELHMDMLAGGIADDNVFQEKVDSLALRLSNFFGDKSRSEYARMLREARRDGERYQLIQAQSRFPGIKGDTQVPDFQYG